MLDNKGFDMWADGYDKSVNHSEENNEYPFAGYKKVLNYIYNQVREQNSANVLDIGFGTGVLTTRLYDASYNITGIDFSNNMIDIAKKKMPNATLVKWDFSTGLPNEVKSNHFDYIISTYAFHHLADKEKIGFIELLATLLNENGKILIGDISFETRDKLKRAKEEYKEYWDDDEFYFIAEDMMEKLSDKYLCMYTKVSHCAGVLTISNK